MKKINSLLKLDDEKLERLEKNIDEIITIVYSEIGENTQLGLFKLKIIKNDIIYELLSVTGSDLKTSLKMFAVVLKCLITGFTKERSMDYVIDYYQINVNGFLKTDLEEMIKEA